jgi:serine/threonine protein kinase
VGEGADLGRGQIVAGKYRIEGELGRGGMGVVLEARHLDLDQRVAMKLLLPEAMKSAEAVERFLREGRAAARLSTPHVAKVHDVGRLETGQPFLVMEFLRGRDLKAIVEQRGAQPLADVVRWVREAAEALGEAHGLGIVHRDIKPANLFLAELPNGRTTVKVVDFGISKQIDPGGVDLTRTSAAMGSPLYMAPEQVMSTKHVDPRVDVWALGVVLYEMATGRTPFLGTALTEVIGQIMTRDPAPPSALRADLPPAFDQIVMTCLRKDPQHRYATMADLDAALRDLGSTPVAQGATGTAPATSAPGYPSAPHAASGGPGHSSSSHAVPRAPVAAAPVAPEASAATQPLPAGMSESGRLPPAAATSGIVNTQQGWGTTGAATAVPAPGRAPIALVAGAIAAVALLGAGGTFLLVRGDGPTPAGGAVATAELPSPPSSAPAIEPTPTPSPSAPRGAAVPADEEHPSAAGPAPSASTSAAPSTSASSPVAAARPPPAVARPAGATRRTSEPAPPAPPTASPAVPKKPSMY